MADTWAATIKDWVDSVVVTAGDLDAEVRDRMDVLERVINGDTSTAKKHKHKNGTLANRPAAAEAGRVYYATDLGALFLDDGTQWLMIGVVHQIAQHFFDDFFMDSPTDRGFGWGLATLGSGAILADIATGYSVLRATTGATGGWRGGIRAKSSPAGHYDIVAGSVPAIVTFRGTPEQTTQAITYLGLLATTLPASAADPTDGIYFKRADSASGGNWFAKTRSGGVETSTDTTVAAGTTHKRFDIIIETTTSVKFYIDGTLRATHTTNIPTAVLNLTGFIDNLEAAAKILSIDYVEMLAVRKA